LAKDNISDSFDEVFDTPVWGADAIGAAINRSRRQTFHLLENELIDADKIGGRWCSTRRRLLRPQRGLAAE
jgi:hypothetical protein